MIEIQTDMHFGASQKAAVIAIAVGGGLMPALQPVLLGTLLAEGRIDAVELGRAATAEGLGMAISVTLASRFLSAEHLRWPLTVALLVMALCNMSTPFAGAEGLITLRALSGISCGILLWLILGMFARVQDPARLFAIYVTAQSTSAFLLSATISNFIAPYFGSMVSYGMVAAFGLVLLAIPPFIPPSYPPLHGSGSDAGPRPTLSGLPGLAAIFLYMAAIIGFWAYLLPVGEETGIARHHIAQAMSLSLAVQIAGGLAACATAGRISAATAFCASAAASIAGLLLAISGTLVGWYLGTAIFAFAWIFCPPFHIPFLLTIDPSRRSALFAGSAQLFGVSFGPFAASLTVQPQQMIHVAWLSLAFLMGSAMLVIGLFIQRLSSLKIGC
ncbi:hypothetical protein VVT58_17070 (plasmid) [Sphingobium sp. SJ10-10]|uniref:hypothetical protein n=1 Tax=Sphingobium sp. SJ10-10 TaxID=3114999 RepID=UPI002E18EF95|nr:hypothetical protein [Sphingobium sp. SJ10-10]